MIGRIGQASAGRKSGQALVELAIVAPLLLLFVLGVVLFGRVLHARIAISAAAGAAAREVATASAEAPGLDRARQRAGEVIVGDGLAPGQFQLSIDDGGFVRGGTVTVRTSYTMPIFGLPLSSTIVRGPTVTVHAVDQERIGLYRARAPSR